MDYKKLIFRFMYLFLLSSLFFIVFSQFGGSQASIENYKVYLISAGILSSVLIFASYGIWRGFIAAGVVLIIPFVLFLIVTFHSPGSSGMAGLALSAFLTYYGIFYLIGVPLIREITKLYERIGSAIIKIILLISFLIVLLILIAVSATTCHYGQDFRCITEKAIEEENVEICDKITGGPRIADCYSNFEILRDHREQCYEDYTLVMSTIQGLTGCISTTLKDSQVDQKFLDGRHKFASLNLKFYFPGYYAEKKDYLLVGCYENNLDKDYGDAYVRRRNMVECAENSKVVIEDLYSSGPIPLEGEFRTWQILGRYSPYRNNVYSFDRFFEDHILVSCYESNSGKVQETIDCLRESKMYDEYLKPTSLLGSLGY